MPRMGFNLLWALCLVGCQRESAPAVQVPEKVAKGPAVAQAAPVPLGRGRVHGVVTFEGAPPAPEPLTPSADPACAERNPAEGAVQVKDGKLENVLVRIKDPLPEAGEAPSAPVVVDQKACTFKPRVQGAVVGQTLLLKNQDGTLHNVRGILDGKSLFNVALLPQGAPADQALPAGAQVLRFKCDIHPWMRAWVVSSPHRFFATTGADGAFELKGLPAGTFTLEAWHESLGTRTATVTVPLEGEATAAFVFAPVAEAPSP